MRGEFSLIEEQSAVDLNWAGQRRLYPPREGAGRDFAAFLRAKSDRL
jgi:hypothetical protein